MLDHVAEVIAVGKLPFESGKASAPPFAHLGAGGAGGPDGGGIEVAAEHLPAGFAGTCQKFAIAAAYIEQPRSLGPVGGSGTRSR